MEGSVRYAVTKHAEHEPSHFNRVTHIFPLYSLLCHYEFSDCLNNCLLHHPCSFGDLGSPFSLWSLAVLDALSKWYCAVLVILSLSDLLYLVTVLKASPCCGSFFLKFKYCFMDVCASYSVDPLLQTVCFKVLAVVHNTMTVLPMYVLVSPLSLLWGYM